MTLDIRILGDWIMVCHGMGILEIPMDNTPRRSHKAVEYFVIRANHISGHHRNNIARLGKSAKGKDLLIDLRFVDHHNIMHSSNTFPKSHNKNT